MPVHPEAAMSSSPTIHATFFVVDGRGILVRGASGTGKSRLALHFIETAAEMGRIAKLVGDDRVRIEPVENRLIASVPAAIAGLIERRSQHTLDGLRDAGIEKIDFQPSALVSLVVDILPDAEYFDPARKKNQLIELKGVIVPHLAVPGDFSSAVALIERILPQLARFWA
jgi:HPr kinase/phosphorylase